jgi:hypothetical protein
MSYKSTESRRAKELGSHILHKGVGVVDLESASLRCERYDLGIACYLDFGQKAVELSGKRFCLTVSTNG